MLLDFDKQTYLELIYLRIAVLIAFLQLHNKDGQWQYGHSAIGKNGLRAKLLLQIVSCAAAAYLRK